MFDLLMGDLVRASRFRASKDRLRTIEDLDTAAIVLRHAWLTITETAANPEADLRAALEAMHLAVVHSAAEVIGEIAREPDEDFQAELTDRYATV